MQLGDLVHRHRQRRREPGPDPDLGTAANVDVCGTGTVTPTDVTLPMASATAFERYEGMLVRMPQDAHRHRALPARPLRRGAALLRRAPAPADQRRRPGAPANALQAQNDLNQLLVDDASQAQNPDPIVFARGGQPLSASNTLRGGDTTTDPVGVMTYTWARQRRQPNAYRRAPGQRPRRQSSSFTAANPRPDAAPRTSAVTCASSA